ncbi:alpha-ketoglutarate dehydrogenase component 4-like [Corticium candelabrum]|uniref:alpha-ketoglutarate dehydrogenase component 4-like n=1 Tax=Corticium candelabrum TaxID=121492 RepID=UPI002E268B6E|nr:alpha-ketoglutarate dehydrogenase component 4-like [Corticium candelabrum]
MLSTTRLTFLRISARWVHTVKPHRPSIQFPERKRGHAQMESNSAETQSSSAQVSQTTETQTTLILNPGNATQQDLQAFLSLPHRYQRRQLTEAEIEAINMGGER